jgi:hypothetical protein
MTVTGALFLLIGIAIMLFGFKKRVRRHDTKRRCPTGKEICTRTERMPPGVKPYCARGSDSNSGYTCHYDDTKPGRAWKVVGVGVAMCLITIISVALAWLWNSLVQQNDTIAAVDGTVSSVRILSGAFGG